MPPPIAVADLEYKGSAQELVTTGDTDFGTLLYSLDGTSYSADIPTETNAGTYTVYYKVAGDANHNDVSGAIEVTISPKAVTNDGITVTIPSQVWTGSELTPVITVKDGEKTLTLNTDYTVTAPSAPIQDSGNYTYTITGTGNYTGSKEATFAITPRLARQYGAVYLYEDQNGTTALLDGTSVAPVDVPSDDYITVNHVTSNRTFTPGKASTVMLPFSYTCNGEEGGKCETADEGSHWTFKGTYEYKEWISGGANAEEIGRAYGFAGVAKDDIDVGDFVRVASGAKILPMRAYLIWNAKSNSNRAFTRGAADTDEELPKSITVRLVGSVGGDDEQTTAIGTLDTETGEIDFSGWYDMSGHKLSGKPTKKGIYINNGRKVVVK